MTEEPIPIQINNSFNEPKIKSKFWLGFVCGIPIYPLVIPWFLLILPERVSQIYLEYYAVYIRMILKIIGEGC